MFLGFEPIPAELCHGGGSSQPDGSSLGILLGVALVVHLLVECGGAWSLEPFHACLPTRLDNRATVCPIIRGLGMAIEGAGIYRLDTFLVSITDRICNFSRFGRFCLFWKADIALGASYAKLA